jgi:hypothetical protein
MIIEEESHTKGGCPTKWNMAQRVQYAHSRASRLAVRNMNAGHNRGVKKDPTYPGLSQRSLDLKGSKVDKTHHTFESQRDVVSAATHLMRDKSGWAFTVYMCPLVVF